MIWDSWAKDAAVRRLEEALARVGTTVVKMNDYVRIGSFSKTKIFDVETFKRLAADVLRTQAGRGPRDGTRRPGTQERGSDSRRGLPEAGVSRADIEQADGALMRLVTQLLAERDAWCARAMDAEARLARQAERETAGGGGATIAQIKRQLALALHPDATGDARDKQLRAELFKQIWPLLEQLEKG